MSIRNMSLLKARPGMVSFVAVVLMSLTFAIYTGHAWEDYWITFRASRNLATGHGLVFTPGERLHTFTSPLGALLPAALSWLTGNQNDDLVLWLFRLVSITALASAVVLFLQVLNRAAKHGIAVALGLAMVALDAKTVDFAINGQETGLVIFFLALSLHGFLVAGPRRVLRLGLGWAGLMWSRPDSAVYIGVLTIAALIFLPDPTAAGRGRRELLLSYLKAGLLCTVLYLPWFLWPWWYYGSPIPHTVIAKSTNCAPRLPFSLLRDFLLFPFALITGKVNLAWLFMPAYAVFGGWHYALSGVATALGLAAAFAWVVPLVQPGTRMLSLAFYTGLFFLGNVVPEVFPWYLPTVAALGYLTISLMFDQLLELAHRLPRLGWIADGSGILCRC